MQIRILFVLSTDRNIYLFQTRLFSDNLSNNGNVISFEALVLIVFYIFIFEQCALDLSNVYCLSRNNRNSLKLHQRLL